MGLGEISFKQNMHNLISSVSQKNLEVGENFTFLLMQQKRSYTNPREVEWKLLTSPMPLVTKGNDPFFISSSPTKRICPSPLHPARLPFNIESKPNDDIRRRGFRIDRFRSVSFLPFPSSGHSHGAWRRWPWSAPHWRRGSIYPRPQAAGSAKGEDSLHAVALGRT